MQKLKISSKKHSKIIKAFLFGNALFWSGISMAQTDTLHVMTYNVLYYGDTPPCQGPHSASHAYLESIVAYTSPDLIGLEKMAAIPMYTGDMSGTAPKGFADSILRYALNAAFPGRYAYCTYTNNAHANNIDVLFYNQQKLGFCNIVSTYSNITDFNTYKLYYKSASLATTHDTIFIYVTLNHDNSGTGSSDATIRGEQIEGEMAQIATHFSSLPNMINMGDFNTHTSTEACYQTLVAPSNAGFKFFDAPFSLDGDITYPADWDANPGTYGRYLTTSTRLSSSVPNSCGSSGGGYSWFDHIFLSAPLVTNSLGMRYVPHSYRTIGNDGNRAGISINDMPTNTSAPASVITALFEMSNKYPVMLDLEVNGIVSAVPEIPAAAEKVKITNPTGAKLQMHFDAELMGKTISLECTDALGRLVNSETFTAEKVTEELDFTVNAGIYFIKLTSDNAVVCRQTIYKQ